MKLRIIAPLLFTCISPLIASQSSMAAYTSGLISTNDPTVQQNLLEIRQLAKIPATATHDEVEDVILKGMVQAFGLGEMNLYDFDLLIRKQNLESIMKSKKSRAVVYSELLALRNIKETLEGALKAIIVRESEDAINDGVAPDFGAHILTKIDTMRKFAVEEESKHVPYVPGSRRVLLDLALEEVSFFAKDLNEYITSGNRKAFGKAEDAHSKITTAQVTQLRESGVFAKVSRDHERFESLFSPRPGEKGLDVYAWMQKDAERINREMKESLDLNRGPSEEPAFKIYPSAGPAGNITGSSFPKGTWALTYDDGPGKTTPGVIKNLKDHHLSATFFMLSEQIDQSKPLQSYAKEEFENFETASHSYSHPQMPKLSAKAQHKEIEGAAQIYERVLGVRPRYFRLPYGAGVSIPSVREKIAKSCMVHVFWNVDTLDWQDKNPTSIKERTIKQIENLGRGVILFHDIHPQSVIASEMIMTYFQNQQKQAPEKKIRLVTLSEITDELNGGKKWACEVNEAWKKGDLN